MNLLQTPAAAKQTLKNAAYNPRTLALIHSGIALAVSLIATVLNTVLSHYISSTAGLGGLGTRAILQSAQSILSTGSNLLLPFWQIGFSFAALCLVRNQQVGPLCLSEGFRRFGKVLRTFLLLAVMFAAILFACMNLASILFFFTPFSASLTAELQPLLQDAQALEAFLADPASMDSLVQQMIPLYVIVAVVMLAAFIPLLYRLRMAMFAIMDDAPGALAAIMGSIRLMKGNCIALFRVDLKFWWFYALKILAATVAYGDVLLSYMGVALPVSATVAFYGAYGIYIVLELFICWRFSAHIQTTYAHCYEELKANISRPATIEQL